MPDSTPLAETSGVRAVRGFLRRRWIGVVLLVPPALATLWLPPLIAADSRLAALASLLAWPVLGAGISLRLWSTLHIGGRKRERVVSDGPYSICRNPLYLATVLNAVSAALFFKSPFLLAAAGLLGLSYVWLTIPDEERFLASTLGEPYLEYRRRVPRLVPRPWLYRRSAELDVHFPALRRELRRSAWWLLVPVLSYALELARP
jgi:protein-S-isoprenylcysteine O-methyltransferase Ste14